jgi:hypothetical protein
MLMAPHHGSHRIDIEALTRWCKPALVVSCQGPPRGAGRAAGIYRREGSDFWATHEHGAIEIRIDDGLTARAFLSGRSWRAP